MAKELNISTGAQEYNINGAVVSFNGTDYQFAQRLVTVFDRMDGLQNKYIGQLQANRGADVFKACRQVDREMRDVIDGLFQAKVADKIFGSVSCYALSDGLPIWVNLILAIMDEVDASILEQQAKTDPRLDAYVAKYKSRTEAE